MSRKLINQNDVHRLILTDTLPYEVPFVFSNYHFHAFLGRFGKSMPQYIDRMFSLRKKEASTKPFDFQIRKSDGGLRKLTVPHPALQLSLCSLYSEFSEILIYLSSRSEFSIRHPHRIASHFFERDGLNAIEQVEEGQVEAEVEPFEVEPNVASSYFTYRKYNLQYKFFESFEFINLEKKFSLFASFDVHKCFYNIYTHTFSWAVKGREYAKRSRHEGFENAFDQFMQSCNYGETNGIIVGPEFSRVFAEIIFQSLDLEVQRRLSKHKLHNGVDYQIKRYVDDYFVFANSKIIIEQIEKLIEETLGENRLYLNKTKRQVLDRPFLSDISKAKMGLSKSASHSVHSLLTAAEQNRFHLVTKSKSRFIDEFRALAVDARRWSQPLAKFALAILGRRLPGALKKLREIPDQRQRDRAVLWYCSANSELFEYFYCLSPEVRSSLILSRAFLRMLSAGNDLSDAYCKEVVLLLSQRTKSLLSMAAQRMSRDVSDLNLLILDRQVNPNDGFSAKSLSKWFKLEGAVTSVGAQSPGQLNYFEVCTLVFYVRDRSEYDDLKVAIENQITTRFSQTDLAGGLHRDTEMLLLALDLMSCPWISAVTRKTIADQLVRSIEPSMQQQNACRRAIQVLQFCEKRRWFFDWHAAEYLEKTLDRKELIPAYG